MSGATSASAYARWLRMGLIGPCVLAVPLVSAQIPRYNVIDQRITSYDVDKDNVAETRALSQWVQGTWLKLPQPQFAAMQWLDTTLIDFWPTEYNWGLVPNPPAISGWFTANTFFFGVQTGSRQSATAWSTVTASSGYTIATAPARFTPSDCFFTCTPRYTVSLSTSGSSTAPYHVPNGVAGGGASSGSTLFEVPEGIPLTPAGLAVGEVRTVGASLDIIDFGVQDVVENLFELVSTVEMLASGDYAYGYRMHNNSNLAVEALWEGIGFGELPLRLEPGESSAELNFVSPFAPASASSLATLSFEGQFATWPLQGSVEVFRPVPLPASVWLLGAAVLALVSGRRSRLGGRR